MKKSTKLFLAGVTVLILVFTGAVILAQDTTDESIEATEELALDEDIGPGDLEVGDPKILPDHPLYFLKNWARGIRNLFAFSPTAKARLAEKFANERLVELNKMVVKNKNANAIKNAAQDYEDEIEKIKSFTERIRKTAQEDEEVGKFLDKFTQHQALHQRVLQKLEERVSPEVFEKIKEVRQNHLETFKDVMLKLEDKDKIPERIEQNLEKLKGSKFKDFKNLELFEELIEKLPEDVQQKMEQKKEEILERLRQNLEKLPPKDQEKLKSYLDEISGDKLKRLYVLGSLEGKELSEKLKDVVQKAREKNIERIQTKYREIATEEKVQKQIEKTESSLMEAKTMVVEKDIENEEMPAVFRLLELAEAKLGLANTAFDEGKYGNAFGQAVASLALSTNAIRIMEIRAGFGKRTEAAATICANFNFPVCGEGGATYKNICEAKKVGVKIVYRGECKEELSCAKEGERVNRNPLIGATSQACCEGLQEVRVSLTYSVCRNPGVSYECNSNEDCPLPRCQGVSSQCLAGKCVIPRCEKPTVCIQVITPAKNPVTGICREFPTPCEVPAEWIKVSACPGFKSQLKEFLEGDRLAPSQ